MQILKEKWEITYYKYLQMNKKSNVLSSNLLSKTVQKQHDNLHKAQKKRVNPPMPYAKKNAQILRTGLKHIPNATEN